MSKTKKKRWLVVRDAEHVLQTYTLRILSPNNGRQEQDKRVLADLPAMLEFTEESLEVALPDGYQARIVEWDH